MWLTKLLKQLTNVDNRNVFVQSMTCVISDIDIHIEHKPTQFRHHILQGVFIGESGMFTQMWRIIYFAKNLIIKTVDSLEFLGANFRGL